MRKIQGQEEQYPQDESHPVKRYRRNDYVGSPIWGFRGLPPGAKPGDKFHYDDDLFTERDGVPYRTNYVLTETPRGLAMHWADTGKFAGYVG